MAGTRWPGCRWIGMRLTKPKKSFITFAVSSRVWRPSWSARPVWGPPGPDAGEETNGSHGTHRQPPPLLAEKPEHHSCPADDLVCGEFCGELLRPRSELQFLRLALQLLGGGAGRSGGVLPHHRVLRLVHEPARHPARGG